MTGVSTANPRRIRIVCSECRSTDVTRDASSTWDEGIQSWVLCHVFDQGTCNTCGHEVNLDEEVIQDVQV